MGLDRKRMWWRTARAVAVVLAVATAGHWLATPATADPTPRDINWSHLNPGGLTPPRPEQISPLLGLIVGTISDKPPPPAPLVRDYDGQRISISGFPVPLRLDGFKVTEFLLVPYFGACIHVPPPPANQIIHVTTSKPVKIKHLSRSVQVTGQLTTGASDTEWGNAGYRIGAATVRY